MYKTLIKLQKMYKRKTWLKMVEQAKEREKITEEEYTKLLEESENEK